MSLIGNKIDVTEEGSRYFYVQEILVLLGSRLLSWGCSGFSVELKCAKTFKMRVDGAEHKGHVHFFMNDLGLYDIYLTSFRGIIYARTKIMGIESKEVKKWLEDRIERTNSIKR